MTLTPFGHAAIETVSQIGATDFIKGHDDLLLLSARNIHSARVVMRVFMLRGVLSAFFWEMCLVELTIAASRGSGASTLSVAETPELVCLRGLDQNYDVEAGYRGCQ
jgi:hypothetical protein